MSPERARLCGTFVVGWLLCYPLGSIKRDGNRLSTHLIGSTREPKGLRRVSHIHTHEIATITAVPGGLRHAGSPETEERPKHRLSSGGDRAGSGGGPGLHMDECRGWPTSRFGAMVRQTASRV